MLACSDVAGERVNEEVVVVVAVTCGVARRVWVVTCIGRQLALACEVWVATCVG